MDPMQELKKLTDKAKELPNTMRLAVIVGVLLLAIGGIFTFALSSAGGANYEVVFAKLTPEDGAASGDALRAAGIPFRIEAAGDAISVPSGKVHDARLLLAAQGLPRAGGIGFELFDKSDLGVSEFTQRVNLQRAIEGELARTIGAMQKVHDARVHITMPKRGLLRTDDKGAAAAVMLRLEPGRTLDAKEIAGVRHLVAAAVPELSVERVTVVDQNGGVLGGVEGGEAEARNKLEQELESRVIAMLEPALGRGSVVARVTAEMDAAEEDKTESLYNPDLSALRSERTRSEAQNSGAVAGAPDTTGAASNVPIPGPLPGDGRSKTSNTNDQTRTFDVSGSVTRRVAREPRLVKLSVAVIVDSKGKPLAEPEMKKLTDLAKRAVGYDDERGDLFELSSASFLAEPAPDNTPLPEPGLFGLAGVPTQVLAGAAGGLLLIGATLAYLVTRRRRGSSRSTDTAAQQLRLSGLSEDYDGKRGPRDGSRARARDLAAANPERAALILEAWLGAADAQAAAAPSKEANG